jgi:hypothetical protein
MSSLQVASLIASAAGAGMSAYAQSQQARAQRDAARYNQKVAEMQAADALDRGTQEQERLGRKISALRGEQVTAMAANGLDLSYGDQTPASVLAQTDYYGLEDQRMVANNANREAAAYRNRANMSGMQMAALDPFAAGAGSLLTGAGAVAEKWNRYRGGGLAYAADSRI